MTSKHTERQSNVTDVACAKDMADAMNSFWSWLANESHYSKTWTPGICRGLFPRALVRMRAKKLLEILSCRLDYAGNAEIGPADVFFGLSLSRNILRRILPLALLGIASMNSTSTMCLCSASCTNVQKREISLLSTLSFTQTHPLISQRGAYWLRHVDVALKAFLMVGSFASTQKRKLLLF